MGRSVMRYKGLVWIMVMSLALLIVGSHCDKHAMRADNKDAEEQQARGTEPAGGAEQGSEMNADNGKVDQGDSKQEPRGPATDEREGLLKQEQVVPHFQKLWKDLHAVQLQGHPLAARLNELVTTNKPRLLQQECTAYGTFVSERVASGDPELLLGDLAALKNLTGKCWTLHYDGLMGPGLGAAMAPDGEVLLIWIVAEG
ncbi:hypothetical protein ACFLU6_01835 [Acidobacteriota bacterium]